VKTYDALTEAMAIGSLSAMLFEIEAALGGAARWAVICWLCPPKPYFAFYGSIS
jgi:hypothetical protein